MADMPSRTLAETFEELNAAAATIKAQLGITSESTPLPQAGMMRTAMVVGVSVPLAGRLVEELGLLKSGSTIYVLNRIIAWASFISGLAQLSRQVSQGIPQTLPGEIVTRMNTAFGDPVCRTP